MTHHRQVPVYNPLFEEHIEVDEGLSEILPLIWELGLDTGYSCQKRQDKSDMVMIHFLLADHAEKFTTAVVKYVPKKIDRDEETTYQRITRQGCRECWEFEVFPERIEEDSEVKGIYFSTTVFFPADDLEEVVASLKKAVDARESFS